MRLRKITRGAFWIGGLAAPALGIPLLTLAIHAMTQRLGLGKLEASLDETFWISLIFAGVPALLAGGGVARLVAHRMAERPELTLARAVLHGGAAMAVGGIGMALLAGMPLGVLSEHPVEWVPLGIAGLLVGAVTGMAITVLVALRQRRFGAKGTPA